MADTDAEWASLVARASRRVSEVEALNADGEQRGRSWALPIAPGSRARTPVWSSRSLWQHQLRCQLRTAEGSALCRQHHVSAEAVHAVGVAHAGFADSRTGRDVTASREILASKAGVSVTVVKRGRRVLSALGMAVEMTRGRFLTSLERDAAEAHHGGRQTRAASGWALVSPREVVVTTDRAYRIPRVSRVRPTRRRPNTRNRGVATGVVSSTGVSGTSTKVPQRGSRGPLSLKGFSGVASLVRENSPMRARAHAGESANTQRQRAESGPRPLALQRSAAELIACVPALSGIERLRFVCDVLTAAGIDADRWSGRDIARRLDEDTRERGWVWPADVAAPIALLRWRLTRIDLSGPSHAEQRLQDRERARQARNERLAATADRATRAASPEVRAAAIAQAKQALTNRRTTGSMTTAPTNRSTP